jgi:hypothetical protein
VRRARGTANETRGQGRRIDIQPLAWEPRNQLGGIRAVRRRADWSDVVAAIEGGIGCPHGGHRYL